MKNMIKAVLFDFDGVLTIDGSGSESICNYVCKKTGIDLKRFEEEYYKYNDDFLCGKIQHKDIWDKICRSLNTQIDINILYDSFLYTPMDNKMMKIIEKLKNENYKIAMVTDNKKDGIDKLAEHYNWNKVFDAISISSEVGSGKNYSTIFKKALECLYLKADECVFIDNQEKNLIVPKKMEMNVIYFDHRKRDYEKFIQELKKIGINI